VLPRRRVFAALLIAALAAGCSGTTVPIVNPTTVPSTAASSAPESAAASSAAATPAETATEVPAAVTPEPSAAAPAEPVVEITQKFFRNWKNIIGSIEFQIVLEVKNTGGGYANISRGDRSYTIYLKDGTVLATGDFTYAFPQVLGPGATGYFVDTGSFDTGTKSTDVGALEPSVSFGSADGPHDAYAVSKVTVGAESYGSGLQVSGVVKNTSSADASMGIVGVVFFDGAGKILGALYDNTGISDLRAGQSKGFKTSYPGTPPLKPTQVKSTKSFAFDYSFF
jgi:hypothetical protein